jgi:hypothetical protein
MVVANNNRWTGRAIRARLAGSTFVCLTMRGLNRVPGRASTVALVETDPAAVIGRSGSRELADRLDQGGGLFVVRADAGLEFRELAGEGLLIEQEPAQADEGADDIHAHGNGLWRVEDACGHHGTVLGEGKRVITAPITTSV